MKLKKNLKFDRNLHFKERHISSDSRFFYIKFWITNIKKLVSNILTYLRPVNCFDLNFVFWTSWWKCPTPGISSLSIWLFFFHPNRHSVPEKAKKVVKILQHRWLVWRRWPWERFFFPGFFFFLLYNTTWPSYFYFCTSVLCAVKSTTILTQMMIRSDVVVGYQKYQKLHSGFGVLK